MRYIKILLFIFVLVVQVDANVVRENIKFEIKSDFPKDNVWIKKLLRNSTKEINRLFAPEDAVLPKKILVTLKKDMRVRGIRGNARRSNNSINFSSSLWQKDKFRIWIIVHELINLLVSHYGTTAYPSDWWANGRSPFPVYAAYLVMNNLGYKKEAQWLIGQNKHIPDQKFYLKLHNLYGSKLFKQFFTLIKKYDIKLAKIGKPWPTPDKERSLVTLSLLSMAANKNLAALARYYKIGKRPKDWHKRHPKIPFKVYEMSEEDIHRTIGYIYLLSK